jgi:hypothetical protein
VKRGGISEVVKTVPFLEGRGMDVVVFGGRGAELLTGNELVEKRVAKDEVFGPKG